MKLSKLLLAGLGATVVLGALVSTASAGRLEVSSQTLRAAFSEVIFTEPFSGEVRCVVTLEGSLHSRIIQKVAGTLIGYITRADLGRCVEPGTATILRETLPWHVRYASFSGTLPNITRLTIHVIGSAFRVDFPFGPACLARTEPNEPAIGNFERNTATTELTAAEIGGRIRTDCLGISGTFASTRTVPTVLNSATRIRVTLI
jgi:hypothetical protein